MEQPTQVRVNEFLRRLEAYDFDGALALCTGTAVVWQNDGEPEQAMSERLSHFKSWVASVDSLRYDVVHQVPSADEVFQQHVLHVNLADGTADEVHAAVYFKLDGDLIDRIEEFVYPVPVKAAA